MSNTTLPFGKYKDTDLADVPEHYLRWWIGHVPMEFEPELEDAINNELCERATQILVKFFTQNLDSLTRLKDMLADVIRKAEEQGHTSESLDRLKELLESNGARRA